MADRDPREHSEQLDELRRQFPGWQIWTSGATWCARPEPLINTDSAESLAELIRSSHDSPPRGLPSLASWRSYRARLRRLRDWETANAAVWMRRRAEADARRASLAADPFARFRARHRAADRRT